jgi:glycosyltransferase involved in cell wall biosynthesis
LKFSIITAVYNRDATIGQALDSVAQQSYGDVEHLVVDGASTDGTLNVVNAHHHPGMRVISEPDDGIYDALNKGISAAGGDVIGLMHSDDFFAHDNVLSNVAKSFAQTGADAVYGDLDYVSARDPEKIIRHWQSGSYDRRKLVRGWMPPHPALFVRREVLERYGNYDTSYRIAADYDAILRWFWTGNISAAYLPEVLVKMRVGGESNRSIGRIVNKSKEDYRALRSNGVGGIGTLAWKNLSKLPQFLNK